MTWTAIRRWMAMMVVRTIVTMGMAIALFTTGIAPAHAAEPSSEPEAAIASTSLQGDAKTLLQTAYDKRYTWNQAFPGYQAEVAIRYQDTYVQGNVLVDPNLRVATKNIVDKDILQVILAQLQMVSTQLQPTTFEEMHGQYEFSLIRNEGDTAEISETKDGSSARYIVKNQEMIQVNRDLGEYAIEIKTLDSLKTPEGYLQTHFQAIFRDSKTAAIVEQDDIRDSYEKVGGYYLLAKREIRRGNTDSFLSKLYPDTTLRFSHFQLLSVLDY